MKKIASFFSYTYSLLFISVIFCILLISGFTIWGLNHILISLIFMLFVFAAFYLLTALPENFNKLLYPALSVLLGIIIKLGWLIFIGSQMQMKYDYLTALESARGIFAEKELVYVHWALYPRILSVFMKIFGNSYNTAIVFNIIVTAFSSLLVYLTAKSAFGKIKIAFAASLIFALWPSYNLYNLITSNEHLAILFALSAVYFLQLAIKQQGIKRYLFLFFSGISLGFVDFFKQFSIVFFIAFIISSVLWYFKKNSLIQWKKVFSSIIAFAFLFLITSGTKNIVFSALDNYYGTPVCRSATAHFIYMGLNSTGKGVWNDSVGFDFPNLIKENNGDYEKASGELFQILKNDLHDNIKVLPETLKNKLRVDWSADTGVVDWVSWLYKDGTEAFPGKNFMYLFSSSFYFVVLLFILTGEILCFKSKEKKSFFSLLFSLFIFGFFLLLILTEAQGRYQLVLFPWFAILSSFYGFAVCKRLREKLCLSKKTGSA